jgi:hypothetical protein
VNDSFFSRVEPASQDAKSAYQAISLALPDEEIQKLQSTLEGKKPGEKTSFWNERFIGTPYDKETQVENEGVVPRGRWE